MSEESNSENGSSMSEESENKLDLLGNTSEESDFENGSSMSEIEQDVRVVGVSVRAGQLIDQYCFHFHNGLIKRYGDNGGREQPLFQLNDGEYIKQVNYRQGDNLDAIQFVTNTERESKMWGNTSGGNPQSYSALPHHEIIGIEREHGYCSKLKNDGFIPRKIQETTAFEEVLGFIATMQLDNATELDKLENLLTRANKNFLGNVFFCKLLITAVFFAIQKIGRSAKCPRGHTLVENKTPREGFGCDECGSLLPQGTPVHSCRSCDFDACKPCFRLMLLQSDETAEVEYEEQHQIQQLGMQQIIVLILRYIVDIDQNIPVDSDEEGPCTTIFGFLLAAWASDPTGTVGDLSKNVVHILLESKNTRPKMDQKIYIPGPDECVTPLTFVVETWLDKCAEFDVFDLVKRMECGKDPFTLLEDSNERILRESIMEDMFDLLEQGNDNVLPVFLYFFHHIKEPYTADDFKSPLSILEAALDKDNFSEQTPLRLKFIREMLGTETCDVNQKVHFEQNDMAYEGTLFHKAIYLCIDEGFDKSTMEEIVQLFITKGANINVPVQSSNHTIIYPFHLLLSFEEGLHLADFFLHDESKLEVNAKSSLVNYNSDATEMMALHSLLLLCNQISEESTVKVVHILETLLRMGADANLPIKGPDSEEMTPLQIALDISEEILRETVSLALINSNGFNFESVDSETLGRALETKKVYEELLMKKDKSAALLKNIMQHIEEHNVDELSKSLSMAKDKLLEDNINKPEEGDQKNTFFCRVFVMTVFQFAEEMSEQEESESVESATSEQKSGSENPTFLHMLGTILKYIEDVDEMLDFSTYIPDGPTSINILGFVLQVWASNPTGLVGMELNKVFDMLFENAVKPSVDKKVRFDVAGSQEMIPLAFVLYVWAQAYCDFEILGLVTLLHQGKNPFDFVNMGEATPDLFEEIMGRLFEMLSEGQENVLGVFLHLLDHENVTKAHMEKIVQKSRFESMSLLAAAVHKDCFSRNQDLRISFCDKLLATGKYDKAELNNIVPCNSQFADNFFPGEYQVTLFHNLILFCIEGGSCDKPMLALVQHFIEKGADPNAPICGKENGTKLYPLHLLLTSEEGLGIANALVETEKAKGKRALDIKSPSIIQPDGADSPFKITALSCALLLLNQISDTSSLKKVLNVLNFVVDNGADVNKKVKGPNEQYVTPLQLAIENPRKECREQMVLALIKSSNFDFNRNFADKKMLHSAIELPAVFNELIKNESLKDKFDADLSKGFSAAFADWVTGGNENLKPMLEKLLEVAQNPIFLNEFMKVKNGYYDEMPPLNFAVRKKHVGAVQSIFDWLKKWLKPDEVESLVLSSHHENNTALHEAALLGNDGLEIAKFLAEKGGFLLQAKNSDEQTALHIAAAKGCQDMVSHLKTLCPALLSVQDKDKNTPLHVAVSNSSPKVANDTVESLLKSMGSGIGKPATDHEFLALKDCKGNTALHLAVSKKNLQIVEQLSLAFSKAKISSCLPNEEAKTPLHLAVEHESIPIIQSLLSCNAGTGDEHAQQWKKESETSESPLHLAIQRESLEIVEELLKNSWLGVDFTCFFDKQHRTPLHLAVQNFSVVQEAKEEEEENTGLKIIRKLFEANGDSLMSVDNDGNTVLHLACMNGHHILVKEFIEHIKSYTTQAGGSRNKVSAFGKGFMQRDESSSNLLDQIANNATTNLNSTAGVSSNQPVDDTTINLQPNLCLESVQSKDTEELDVIEEEELDVIEEEDGEDETSSETSNILQRRDSSSNPAKKKKFSDRVKKFTKMLKGGKKQSAKDDLKNPLLENDTSQQMPTVSERQVRRASRLSDTADDLKSRTQQSAEESKTNNTTIKQEVKAAAHQEQNPVGPSDRLSDIDANTASRQEAHVFPATQELQEDEASQGPSIARRNSSMHEFLPDKWRKKQIAKAPPPKRKNQPPPPLDKFLKVENNDGQTCLNLALLKKHEAVTHFLLQPKFHKHFPTFASTLEKSMMDAVKASDSDAIEAVINASKEEGTNITIAVSENMMLEAVKSKNMKVLSTLLEMYKLGKEKGKTDKIMLEAIKGGEIETTALLIDKGNFKVPAGPQHKGVLCLAIESLCKDTEKHPLFDKILNPEGNKLSYDVFVEKSGGKTALLIAVEKKFPCTFTVLLQAVTKNFKDLNSLIDDKLLSYVIKEKATDILKILLSPVVNQEPLPGESSDNPEAKHTDPGVSTNGTPSHTTDLVVFIRGINFLQNDINTTVPTGQKLMIPRVTYTKGKIIEQETVLHEAARFGDAGIIKVVIDCFDNDLDFMTKKNSEGRTALHVAGETGEFALFRPLEVYFEGKHIELRKKQKENPTLMQDKNKLTPIELLERSETHRKASEVFFSNCLNPSKNTDALQLLQSMEGQRSLLNYRNKNDTTALHIVAKNFAFICLVRNSVELRVKFENLRRKLKDLEKLFQGKETDCEMACIDYVEKLQPCYDEETSLLKISLDEIDEILNKQAIQSLLKTIIEYKADPNALDSNRNTPLNIISRSVEATGFFLELIAKNNIELLPNPHFVEYALKESTVYQALSKETSESEEELHKSPTLYIAYYIFILDSLNSEQYLPRELDLHVSKSCKRIHRHVYKICLESNNPMFHLIQSAAAMSQRSLKAPMLKDDYDLLKTSFLQVAHEAMGISEMDDVKNVFEVLGDNTSSKEPLKFLEKGTPFALALKLGLSEVVALPQSVEALQQAFGAERFITALGSDNLEWETSIFPKDGWSVKMYRQIPYLRALTSFLFHLIFLSVSYTLLDNHTPYFKTVGVVLLLMVVGYVVEEVRQMRQDMAAYTENAWNFFDILMLATFFLWFAVQWDDTEHVNADVGKIVMAFGSFFLLLRLLNYVYIFSEHTGLLVAVLLGSMGVVRRFLAFSFVIMWAFAMIFTATFQDVPEFQNIPKTLLNLFQMALGNFDMDIFLSVQEERRYFLGMAVFITYLIVAMVVLMNILIALLGVTFNDFEAKRYEKYCMLFAAFVSAFYFNESDDWLPAPLCLISAILLPFSNSRNKWMKEFSKSVTFVVDTIVTLLIVLPYCWVIRHLQFFRSLHWRTAVQNGVSPTLFYLFQMLILSPILFGPWFALKVLTNRSDGENASKCGWRCIHIVKDFRNFTEVFLHNVELQQVIQEQQAELPNEKCVAWNDSMAEKIQKLVKRQKSQVVTSAVPDKAADTYPVVAEDSIGKITSTLLLLENRMGSLEQTLSKIAPSNVVDD